MIRLGNMLVSPGEGGVYGERTLDGYRVWDPYRSKLAALYTLGGGVELTARDVRRGVRRERRGVDGDRKAGVLDQSRGR